MDDTFWLSNMSPQVGKKFNRGYWRKLETRVRDWAAKADNLYVFTGPLYLPFAAEDNKDYVQYQVIGKNKVAVPTHFFKVMMRDIGRRREMQAFVVPHRAFEGEVAGKVIIDAVALCRSEIRPGLEA